MHNTQLDARRFGLDQRAVVEIDHVAVIRLFHKACDNLSGKAGCGALHVRAIINPTPYSVVFCLLGSDARKTIQIHARSCEHARKLGRMQMRRMQRRKELEGTWIVYDVKAIQSAPEDRSHSSSA